MIEDFNMDKFQPNLFFLIVSLVIFSFIIFSTNDLYISTMFVISYLTLGFTFSFGKYKVKQR